MSNAFWNMKLREDKVQEFKSFIHEQERDTQDILLTLKTTPRSMQILLENKVKELKDDFHKHLRSSEEETASELNDLDKLLRNDLDLFSKFWKLQFIRALEKLKQQKVEEFETYINEQERDTQDILLTLKTTPRSMQILLENKVKELKDDFHKHLRSSEEETASELNDLDKLLRNDLYSFSKFWNLQFIRALEKLKQQKVEEFETYINKQEQHLYSNNEILRNTPVSMRKRLERKSKSVLEEFKKHMGESGKELLRELPDLDDKLQQETEKCIKYYTQSFENEIEKLRAEKLKEFEQYVEEQVQDTSQWFNVLWTSPSSLQERLEKKANELTVSFLRCLGDSNAYYDSTVSAWHNDVRKHFHSAYETFSKVREGKVFTFVVAGTVVVCVCALANMPALACSLTARMVFRRVGLFSIQGVLLSVSLSVLRASSRIGRKNQSQ
ncbi:reticulocyte-binding protein 2-like [Carcharodon carcharias]|uniref:reticulocyte-binding protein 2-like n=1 Tax=Carcharodon carcharias TaxID=13397 RepID=UPI001B7F023C|nr:reticulocyte-binding protein 2-like [Carcharodon carcharias]